MIARTALALLVAAMLASACGEPEPGPSPAADAAAVAPPPASGPSGEPAPSDPAAPGEAASPDGETEEEKPDPLATATPPPPDPPNPDACGAETLQESIGSALQETELPAEGPLVRHIGPTTIVTMDVRPERLNIHLDAEGVVIRIACG